MRKEKFKYLYSFKFKNTDYIYIISKNYPFYFLKYNKSLKQLEYPDIETFKELYNKFYFKENVLYSNLIDDFKKIKNKLINSNININPLIKTTSGLLSLTLALSMCGCNQTKVYDNLNQTNKNEIVDTIDKNQEIYNYFQNYNMNVVVKEYNDSDYVFVNDFKL